MKLTTTLLILLLNYLAVAQVPTYYSSIDFSQSGTSVKAQLASLITTTHNAITYSECWDVLKASDLDTGSLDRVLLVYGYDDGDGNPITDRTRHKDLNGGSNGEWNREHVFPKSLGTPDLGTSGPGSDAHNLRSSDVQQNGNRANKLFTDGSGNAGTSGSDWYPGDEFKGDCARIVMYMYLRYNTRCLPSSVGTGSTNSTDPAMMNLFLDWNADDPVSQFEKDRNDGIQNGQGNRNPFIDNPSIATKIWGGPIAEDPWGGLGAEEETQLSIVIYPMPVSGDLFYISGINTLEIDEMNLINMSGQLVEQLDLNQLVANGGISVEQFENGSYILSIQMDETIIHKRVIIQ